uniref:Uncharacterized protein n=1 Tax=Neospora caninum (strain Liverpool) TaxID=572307 RepID=A0A0F7U4R5_NEOCL|nr:TPA: hypothetical protein BN1204_006400 [Neospora caninum Liverpool]
MECVPGAPLVGGLSSVNVAQWCSGDSADLRNSGSREELRSERGARRSSDASIWTDILSVSIPENLCNSASVQAEDIDTVGTLARAGRKQGMLPRSKGAPTPMVNTSLRLASSSVPVDETSRGAGCGPDASEDKGHMASRMEVRAGCRRRERSSAASSCVSSGVSASRVRNLSEAVRTGKSAGGSGRSRLALGAVGRQLLLDRIRTRYHTNAVYYSALLRNKYNSTISKLPFFTVSLLHQLAADFEVDTNTLVSPNVENGNASGGNVRSACGRSRGMVRATRRTPVSVDVRPPVPQTAVFSDRSRAQRTAVRVKGKVGRKLQHTEGSSFSGLSGRRTVEMDQGKESFAGVSGSTGDDTPDLCTPTARNAGSEDKDVRDTVADIELFGRKVLSSSRDAESFSAWLLSRNSASRESLSGSSEENGVLGKAHVYTPGTGSTESVPSSPIRSDSGGVVRRGTTTNGMPGAADVSSGRNNEGAGHLEVGIGEKSTGDTEASLRTSLEEQSKANPNRSYMSTDFKDVENVYKGIAALSATAANVETRSGVPGCTLPLSSSLSLKRSRPDIEVIEAMLGAARSNSGEASSDLEKFKSHLLAGLSLRGSETASKKSKILQATASESTTIPSSPTSPTAAAVELLAAAELWSTSRASAHSGRRTGSMRPADTELSAAASTQIGGEPSDAGGASGNGSRASGSTYGKGDCWLGEASADDGTASGVDLQCRLLAALSRQPVDMEVQGARFLALASVFPTGATAVGDSAVNHARHVVGHSGASQGGNVGLRSGCLAPPQQPSTADSPPPTEHAQNRQDTVDSHLTDASAVLAVTVGDVESFLQTQVLRRWGGRSNLLGETGGGRLQARSLSRNREACASTVSRERDLRMCLRGSGNDAEEDYEEQDVAEQVRLLKPRQGQGKRPTLRTVARKDASVDRAGPENRGVDRETKYVAKEPKGDARDDIKSGSPSHSAGRCWQKANMGAGTSVGEAASFIKACEHVGVFLAETRRRLGCSENATGQSHRAKQLAEIKQLFLQAGKQGDVMENSDLRGSGPYPETSLESYTIRGVHASVEGSSVVSQRVQATPQYDERHSTLFLGNEGDVGETAVVYYPGEEGSVCSLVNQHMSAPSLEASRGEITPSSVAVKSEEDGPTNRTDCSSSPGKFVRPDQDSNDETSAGSPVPESAVGNNDDDGVCGRRGSPTEESGEGEIRTAEGGNGHPNGTPGEEVAS